MNQVAQKDIKTAGNVQKIRDAIRIAINIDSARAYLFSNGWFNQGNTVANAILEIIKGFSNNDLTLITQYFNEEASLNDIAKIVINNIFNSQFIYDESNIYNCAKRYDLHTTNMIQRIVLDMPRQECINILGYGIRYGIFEKKLVKVIKNANKAREVVLYGYDPYFDSQYPIINITPEILKEDNHPTFDLILARWVLHHVEDKFRWEYFNNFANCISIGGKIVIVEEGELYHHINYKFDKYLKDYFICLSDIVINAALNRAWLYDNDTIQNNFYIQYITEADIHSIESNFSFEYEKTITLLPNHFMKQSIIEYQRIS